jgi:hypothetical protein
MTPRKGESSEETHFRLSRRRVRPVGSPSARSASGALFFHQNHGKEEREKAQEQEGGQNHHTIEVTARARI